MVRGEAPVSVIPVIAGVDTNAVAGALIGRGISLKLMDGVSVEEVLDDIDDMIATLARHIANRK